MQIRGVAVLASTSCDTQTEAEALAQPGEVVGGDAGAEGVGLAHRGERRRPPTHRLPRARQGHEGRRAVRFGQAQAGVDRRECGLPVQLVAEVPVGRGRRGEDARVREPGGAVVGDGHGRAGAGDRLRGRLPARGVQPLGLGAPVGPVALGHGDRLRARFVEVVGLEEAERRGGVRRALQGGGRLQRDHARQRALERDRLAEAPLGEAGAVEFVEREAGAAVEAQAGGVALLQADVEDRRQVAAGVVGGALGGGEAVGDGGGLGPGLGSEGEGQEEGDGDRGAAPSKRVVDARREGARHGHGGPPTLGGREGRLSRGGRSFLGRVGSCP
jgi:hypothetical protein